MNWFKHVFYEETPIQYETIILVIALFWKRAAQNMKPNEFRTVYTVNIPLKRCFLNCVESDTLKIK